MIHDGVVPNCWIRAPAARFFREPLLIMGQTRVTKVLKVVPCAQGSDAEQWTPSTVFVVTDHLVQLLVKNLFRRQGTAGWLVLLLTPSPLHLAVRRPPPPMLATLPFSCIRNIEVRDVASIINTAQQQGHAAPSPPGTLDETMTHHVAEWEQPLAKQSASKSQHWKASVGT